MSCTALSSPVAVARFRQSESLTASRPEPMSRDFSRVPSGVRRTLKHDHSRRERAFSKQLCRQGVSFGFDEE